MVKASYAWFIILVFHSPAIAYGTNKSSISILAVEALELTLLGIHSVDSSSQAGIRGIGPMYFLCMDVCIRYTAVVTDSDRKAGVPNTKWRLANVTHGNLSIYALYSRGNLSYLVVCIGCVWRSIPRVSVWWYRIA